ncbi:DUF2982 domain-containing protein [Photobacterium sanctipauli]|uniref:DUF2982 domain-containing protein n=1 Tax=Photobacterium sanctipauli TaxID=1342794 RepID=A0A2T3NYA0_9GAMM|nr:DUF2982 domain-containing protein [Photobacterium sanctipauli]PSW21178.1 DUF2982 domain-containing protein [Photobacterium sanctipauli]
MNAKIETQYIRPHTFANGRLLYILGLIGAALAGIISFSWPQVAPAAVAILLIASCILALVGYKANQGPELSFTLTFMHLQFHSHYGGWTARWNNIDRIGQASVEKEGWYQPIPWVGVRLKDYQAFIEAICPRVATKLLMDQRPLLIIAHRNAGETEEQIEDILFDDRHYHLSSGKTLKGLQAMLANRMHYNRRYLGYDFFISEDVLDRPAAEFAGLARNYLARCRGLPDM